MNFIVDLDLERMAATYNTPSWVIFSLSDEDIETIHDNFGKNMHLKDVPTNYLQEVFWMYGDNVDENEMKQIFEFEKDEEYETSSTVISEKETVIKYYDNLCAVKEMTMGTYKPDYILIRKIS